MFDGSSEFEIQLKMDVPVNRPSQNNSISNNFPQNVHRQQFRASSTSPVIGNLSSTPHLNVETKDPCLPHNANLKRSKTQSQGEYTKRQISVLIVYGLSQFFIAVLISLQTPFYPREAEKKGLTATEYGFVYGIFELIMFLSCFVYGSHMNRMGPKLTYTLGLVCAGTSSFSFGCLDLVEGRVAFFALSITLRIIQALSCSAAFNAGVVIITLEFHENMTTVFASMETAFGLGTLLGPVLGGAFFVLGGFPLPFIVVGMIFFVIAVINYCNLPKIVQSRDTKVDNEFGLIKLLTILEAFASCFSVFIVASSFGYCAATLEPHIRIFQLTPVQVGLVIAITGGAYAVSAPIAGWIIDRHPYLLTYLAIGSILVIVGFFMIGPFPFLPIPTELWIVCVGLTFLGLGMTAILVSSFLEILKTANKNGFPDGIQTYGLVSALWLSFFSLGNFVGPTISGILYDAVGFRMGTLFVIGCNCLALSIILWTMFRTPVAVTEKKNTTDDCPRIIAGSIIESTAAEENQPLLGHRTEI